MPSAPNLTPPRRSTRFSTRPRRRFCWGPIVPTCCARAAIMACRPGGIVSVPGVYGGFLDKVPFGAAMNKGLTIRTGQTHVNRYALDLLRRIEEGEIDPRYIITHRARLQDGPGLYETFRDKKDGCIKVVLTP